MQAAALGIQMEQIRRANRLWSSDSLFARETLLIPARLDGGSGSVLTPGGFSADSGNSSDSSHEEHQAGAILREAVPECSRRGSLRASVSDQSDSSLSDFLCKIDSSIARTKHQVQKIQGSSQFCCGEEGGQSRRKPVVSRLRHSQAQSGLEVTTQGRKLRSSLQRLEQAQDEIFEL